MDDQPIICDDCRDTGWIEVTGADRRTTMRKCDPCAWVASKRGFAPGVPADEQTARFASYDVTDDNREAVKHARYFVDGVHPALYLHGGVGVGKTKLACAALNECHAKGERVWFLRTPELLLKLQRIDGDAADAYIERLLAVQVLCLDDVGASQGTDFARRTLQIIFDGRRDRGNRTILTSNLDVDALAEFLGDDRLPSRIAGDARIVEVAGDDQRPRRGAERRRTKTAGHSKKGW